MNPRVRALLPLLAALIATPSAWAGDPPPVIAPGPGTPLAPAPAGAGPTEDAAAAGAEEEQFLSAGELLGACEAPADGQEAARQLCLEFIFGLVQTVTLLGQSDPAEARFCIDPQTTAIEQVQARLVEGLSASQARLAEPAYVVASDVLGVAWPCRRFDAVE